MNRFQYDSLSQHLKNHKEAINNQRPNCHLSRQSAKTRLKNLKKRDLNVLDQWTPLIWTSRLLKRPPKLSSKQRPNWLHSTASSQQRRSWVAKNKPAVGTIQTVRILQRNASTLIRPRNANFSQSAPTGINVCLSTQRSCASLLMPAPAWTACTNIQSRGSSWSRWIRWCWCSRCRCPWWWLRCSSRCFNSDKACN